MKHLIMTLLLMGLFISLGSTKIKSEIDPIKRTTKSSDMNKKEKALAFVQAVTSQNEALVRELATTDYIQHNPFIPTGLDSFIGLFPILKENGTSAKAVRVIEDGNFVVLVEV